MLTVFMGAKTHRREFPAELAHAGEVRVFIAWTGAVAGLRGGALSDLATAAEALLTDVILSSERAGVDGRLEVESEIEAGSVKITIRHPELRERRMAGLQGMLDQFLDEHELSPKKAILAKRNKTTK